MIRFCRICTASLQGYRSHAVYCSVPCQARGRYLLRRDFHIAAVRKYQAPRREEINAKQRQWRKDNPELARAYDKQQNARKKLRRLARESAGIPPLT